MQKQTMANHLWTSLVLKTLQGQQKLDENCQKEEVLNNPTQQHTVVPVIH